jgi:hypothetical protein
VKHLEGSGEAGRRITRIRDLLDFSGEAPINLLSASLVIPRPSPLDEAKRSKRLERQQTRVINRPLPTYPRIIQLVHVVDIQPFQRQVSIKEGRSCITTQLSPSLQDHWTLFVHSYSPALLLSATYIDALRRAGE